MADAVGVTAPSIYLHFADKQELLGAVVADVWTELDQEMETAGASADGRWTSCARTGSPTSTSR